MKLPLSWLREYVRPVLDDVALAERITDAGPAVEAITHLRMPTAGANLESFRVGRVVSAEQHPDADRLLVCQVDLGEPELRQIVCGATNVGVGQTVAVALPGAVLPERPPLGEATLRGVSSRGMILSESELQLAADSDGIMVLPDDISAGTPVAEVLPISDTVFELELTSNRPDLMGIYGIAREVHAITGAPLAALDASEPQATGQGSVEDYVSLRVEAPELCPRYMARVVTEVRVGPSPVWLRARLEAAGMRAINSVVDITNYVMLLTGQPLHAFDLDRMRGAAIVVRRAHDGEPVTTLDGQPRVMDSAVLAICDAERPAVIAGIMGAADVEVSATTTRVLLEAATFDGPTVLHAALRLGLRSESSARFEKGLPTELPPVAMAIASRLLVELSGGHLVPGTLDAAAPTPPAAPVALRHARLNAVLGLDIAPDESAAILRRLGCEVHEGPEAHRVIVPYTRRRDVAREIDLIEEVARIHGYGRIPAELPRMVGHGTRTVAQRRTEQLRRYVVDQGYSEIVSYRFVPAGDVDRLRLADDDPRRRLVRLANPISEEMAVMRRSMLPGLLRAAAHNQRRQRTHGALCELGRTYGPAPDGRAEEREFLATLTFGSPTQEHWRAPLPHVDIHAAVGLAQALCGIAGVQPETEPNQAPYFHPVRQARLVAGDRIVGWAGEVHPVVMRNFDVAGPSAVVVIDLEALGAAAPTGVPQFQDLLSVPASTRDLALVVGDDVAAATLVATARRAGGRLVRDARVFDRYVGEQIGAHRVSLAIRLVVADPARTLTDDEISEVVTNVRTALAEQHGAELRG
jgi:phenylalanyl-tRNA synthetase beta chain